MRLKIVIKQQKGIKKRNEMEDCCQLDDVVEFNDLKKRRAT